MSQPEALRLATILENLGWRSVDKELKTSATELRRLHAENGALRAELAKPEPEAKHESLAEKQLRTNTSLVEYILQDDIYNRLTPRVVDIAYSVFMHVKQGKNKDDGGPCDWFNDTKPIVVEWIAKIRKDLAKEKAESQPSPRLTDADWQPIETAPKDGREILLGHTDGSTAVGYWSALKKTWTEGEYGCNWATHWMPLPRPPIKRRVRGEAS